MTAAVPDPSFRDQLANQRRAVEAIWGLSSDPGVMLPKDERLLRRVTAELDAAEARGRAAADARVQAAAERLAAEEFGKLAGLVERRAAAEDGDTAAAFTEVALYIRSCIPRAAALASPAPATPGDA